MGWLKPSTFCLPVPLGRTIYLSIHKSNSWHSKIRASQPDFGLHSVFVSVRCIFQPYCWQRARVLLISGLISGVIVGFRRDCDILTCAQNSMHLRALGEPGDFGMKAVGFLMLPAGWFLVLAAIVLFPAGPLQAAFVLTGVAVEAVGLVLAFRSHLIPREEKG
jgi:hypothetical protein